MKRRKDTPDESFIADMGAMCNSDIAGQIGGEIRGKLTRQFVEVNTAAHLSNRGECTKQISLSGVTLPPAARNIIERVCGNQSRLFV